MFGTNDQTFTRAPDVSTYTGEAINLGGVVASYILFDDVTNFGTDNWGEVQNHYGLSEVQAFGTPVPEPSSLALLGIGVMSLVGCARRKRKQTA